MGNITCMLCITDINLFGQPYDHIESERERNKNVKLCNLYSRPVPSKESDISRYLYDVDFNI